MAGEEEGICDGAGLVKHGDRRGVVGEELAPLWRPSPRCSGELHWERNGTVYYSLEEVGPPDECGDTIKGRVHRV